MQKELDLVKAFHEKFNVLVSQNPALIPKDRAENRFRLMKEEIEEYLNGTKHNDIENIAKELCDILYAVYGTILEHGLQNKIKEIFKEVHESNMSKEKHEYKMIKGPNYREANIKKFFKEKEK